VDRSEARAIDAAQLVRLRRTTIAAAASDPEIAGQGLIASCSRITAEVQRALGEGDHRDEFDRLFAHELESAGKPWFAQAVESRDRVVQIAEWLEALVEQVVIELDRILTAEGAEAT
jgi:hypothetical protein